MSNSSRKKKLSLLLAALITLGAPSAESAYAEKASVTVTLPKENATPKFSDVDFDYEYAMEIYKLAYKGFIKGYADLTFKPENFVKRQEFAAMIVKTLELKVGTTSTSFTDVKKDDWSSKIIETAVKNNLISGKGNGTFGYNENITRQDAAIIAVRAIESSNTEITVNEYLKPIDLNNVSDYAKEYLEKALSLGLIDIENNKVRPKDKITRGELANLMVNMKEFMIKKSLENPVVEIVKYGEWDYENFGTTEVLPLSDTRRIKEIRPYNEMFYLPLTGKEEWSSWYPKGGEVFSENGDNYTYEQLLKMGYIKVEEKYGYDPFFKENMQLERIMVNTELRETGVQYVYEFRTKEVTYVQLSSPISTLQDKKQKNLVLDNLKGDL